MGYAETNSWHLDAPNVPALISGDKIYLYIQTFTDKGIGVDDIEKASSLHDHFLGSEWTKAVVLTKS